jgi:hypothetical protein
MAIRKVSRSRRMSGTRTANPRKRRRKNGVNIKAGTFTSGKHKGKSVAARRAGLKAAKTRAANAAKKKRAAAARRKKTGTKAVVRRRKKRAYTTTKLKGGLRKPKAQKGTYRKHKGRTTRSRTVVLRKKRGGTIRVRVRANPTGLFGIKKLGGAGGVDVAAAVIGTLTASVIKNGLKSMVWYNNAVKDVSLEMQNAILPASLTALAVVVHKAKFARKLPPAVKQIATWAAVASIVLAVNDYADAKIDEQIKKLKSGNGGGYANFSGGYAKFGGASLSPLPRLQGAYVSTNGAMFGGATNAA